MIEFKEAVSKIWQAVKGLTPSEKVQIVSIHCDSQEDIPIFLDAIEAKRIASLLESRNVEINLIVPKISDAGGAEVLKVALASAAVELTCLSNYDTLHWVNRLMTFAFNVCANSNEELKQTFLGCFPAKLLPEDELANDLYVRAMAQEQTTERLEELLDQKTELQEAIQAVRSLEGTITTTLGCHTAFLLVGMLQLAFRHPKVKEFNPDYVRFFAQGLIDQIGEKSPAAKTYLEKGWHLEYDH